jgi:hypothetical protein
MLSEDELREAILLIFANKQVKNRIQKKKEKKKTLFHFPSSYRIYQMQ